MRIIAATLVLALAGCKSAPKSTVTIHAHVEYGGQVLDKTFTCPTDDNFACYDRETQYFRDHFPKADAIVIETVPAQESK